MKRVYMYTVEERLWHWFQAAIMLALMATGIVIHLPQVWRYIDFETAVRSHDVLGVLLAVNAAFGLFWHLVSKQLRQFLPRGVTWAGTALQQVRYYAWGMFHGEPHPMEKTVARKLNPLQQITYVGILNLLLPLQILTGVGMLGLRWNPAWVERLTELGLLAPLHLLGGWLFAAFLVAHVYLTTTGHTLVSNVVAMITGWEDTHEPVVKEVPRD
ncbi:MAG: cytochrome b/b6 domain-containing protein [Myxococcota bacterium]